MRFEIIDMVEVALSPGLFCIYVSAPAFGAEM